MPEWHFWKPGSDRPVQSTGVFGATVGHLRAADANPDVYAVTNLRRKAYKFAKPISTHHLGGVLRQKRRIPRPRDRDPSSLSR
jgi:hypothetical protein